MGSIRLLTDLFHVVKIAQEAQQYQIRNVESNQIVSKNVMFSSNYAALMKSPCRNGPSQRGACQMLGHSVQLATSYDWHMVSRVLQLLAIRLVEQVQTNK